MNLVNQQLILYPVFAMVALVFVVLFRMGAMRFGAMKNKAVNLDFYRSFSGDAEPEAVRVVSRHFVNLFEMPVLFYLFSVVCFVTQQTTVTLLILSWVYVALRVLHTFIHLSSNIVRLRFRMFFLSCMVLLALWAILLMKLLMR